MERQDTLERNAPRNNKRNTNALIGLKQEDKEVGVNIPVETNMDRDAITRQDAHVPSYLLENSVESMRKKMVQSTMLK